MQVVCLGCGHTLERTGSFSLYEQQAVESSPCPACSRLTLSLREPCGDRRQELSRRRRERTTAALREIVAGAARPDRKAS